MPLRIIARRKPKEIELERWDGDDKGAYYAIPDEHTLGEGLVLVAPGDYIAKNDDRDWYPLAAEVYERDFEYVRTIEDA